VNELIDIKRREDNLLDRIAKLEREVRALQRRRINDVVDLAQLTPQLGNVETGQIVFGEENSAGEFTGVVMAHPPIEADGEDWNIAGFNEDALQFGLRASDGKALAGGGTVVLDEDGITIEGGTTEVNSVKWIDTLARIIQEIRVSVSGALTAGVFNVLRQTEADTSQLALVAGSVNGAFADAAAGILIRSDGSEGVGSVRVYSPLATPVEVWLTVNENDTPTEALDVRGNGTIAGYLELEEITVPTDPAATKARIWWESEFLRFLTDAGVASYLAMGQPSAQTAMSNTTETTLFQATIPGNALGLNGSIRVPLAYRIANNTGSNQTIRWRLYYGATTLIDYTTPNIPTNANPYEGLAWFQLFNTGIASGANAQRAQLRVELAAAAAVGSAGNVGGIYNVSIGGVASENSTGDLVLQLTATLSATGGSSPSFRSGGGAALGPYSL
jgi:hypothetical protein